jgi:DNA helicase HerA-like ATPase
MKTQLYEPNSSLRVGHVVEVSGNTIRVELDGKITELSRTVDGVIYPIGQIGSTVKIHFGRRIIFGFVTLLRMRSEEEPKAAVPIDADQRVMEVDLFAEASWASSEKNLTYYRGVSLYPLPRQSVYLVTREEGAVLYRAAEGRFKEGAEPMVPFASYVGAEQTPCRANIDKMFGLHCAILGSTGSGKSGTVAALLHSVLEHKGKDGKPLKPRILIIDPHGEYGQAFGKRAKVYRAYDPIGIEESTGDPIHLPYWLMSAEEFRSLAIGKTEFEATSQHNIIYKAITHARMVAANLVVPAPTGYGAPWPTDGEISEPRARSGVKSGTIAAFDRDKPRPFSLEELENHIRYAQATREKKSTSQSEQIPEGEFGSKGFRSILDKLSVLRSDPRIRFLMEEYKTGSSPTLTSIIGQFVAELSDREGNAQDLRIIDISGLPNEVAGPLTAAIARLLFQYKLYQSYKERSRDPILLVCEEAHRYVPDRGEAEYRDAQHAVRRIAREGRKYGLGLMLVSQRPSDIEGTVISQCNTWLVLRLTNQADHQHVGRFLPDHLSGMTSALSALGRQEALFVGEGAALPARIKVRTLRDDQVPRSNDVQFVEGWTSDKLKPAEIEQIVGRMTNLVVADAAQEERPSGPPTASPDVTPSSGGSAACSASAKGPASPKRTLRAKAPAPPPADDSPF